MKGATLAAALAIAIGAAVHASATTIDTDRAASTAMDKFIAQPIQAFAYRASRKLEAAGSGQRGWLDANTDYSPAAGLQYRITAEGGSGYIRSRVLRALLEEERKLIAAGATDTVALTPANYQFTPDGVDTEGLARVAIKPVGKGATLIAGHLFVRPGDGELIRLEGRLVKNPSFWVTRVHVVRTYQRLNGVLVPVSLESTAQLRLFGDSTLRMAYEYSEINGQPVAHATR